MCKFTSVWFFLGYTAELVLGLCFSLDSCAQLILQFCLTFLFFLEFRCFFCSWASRTPLEIILGPLGPVLARLEAILGHLGATWSHLGTSWASLGGLLGLSWGPLGLSWASLGSLLRAS